MLNILGQQNNTMKIKNATEEAVTDNAEVTRIWKKYFQALSYGMEEDATAREAASNKIRAYRNREEGKEKIKIVKLQRALRI